MGIFHELEGNCWTPVPEQIEPGVCCQAAHASMHGADCITSHLHAAKMRTTVTGI